MDKSILIVSVFMGKSISMKRVKNIWFAISKWEGFKDGKLRKVAILFLHIHDANQQVHLDTQKS